MFYTKYEKTNLSAKQKVDMNKNLQRNQCVDVARFVFAFLVVGIHLPCYGFLYLYPLARCGVPFFFALTGYYMYLENDNIEQRKKRFLCAAGKWFKLWAKYTIITYLILVSINLALGNDIEWTITDIKQFLCNGSCRATDVVVWHGKDIGTSTLWFLYLGGTYLLCMSLLPPPQKVYKLDNHIVSIAILRVRSVANIR